MDAFLRLCLATETFLDNFSSQEPYSFPAFVEFDALYGKLNVCKELAGTNQQPWLTKTEITKAK